MIKIGELIINSSFSVEKAISYFTVTSVSKQVLLFALTCFTYGRLNAFFNGFNPDFNQFPKKPGFPLSALILLDWGNLDLLTNRKR